MRTVGKGLVFFAVALWLSSVTLFDPGKITDRVLRKLVGDTRLRVKTVPGGLEREELEGIREELGTISPEDVRRTLAQFTSWGSRAVGYPGNRNAYEYIKREFEKIGLERVTAEEFTVTVPVDKGASLDVLST
ncbi:MAG: hypothetical protein DRP95_04805, partial [Candidatus Latescibacterota bacterium]